MCNCQVSVLEKVSASSHLLDPDIVARLDEAATILDAAGGKTSPTLIRQAACEIELAAGYIDAQAEIISDLLDALTPFASEADGRRSKGLKGAVCFHQKCLIAAREAIAIVRAKSWLKLPK